MAGRRENSSRECEISTAVAEAQVRFFDLADRKFGFTPKIIALETDIPASTLKGWIAGTSAMSLDGFIKIIAIKGFPNQLASLILAPAGKMAVDDEAEETDIDDLVIRSLELALAHVKARHPDSPGGVRIVHSEIPDIALAAEGVADKAGKVIRR